MSLMGKRALITGGAIRVGRAITLALARAGCDVCIHYGRSAAAAEETRAEVDDLGRKGTLLCADLRLADAVKDLVPRAVAEGGSLDILVNSAAILVTRFLHIWGFL